MSEEKRGMKRQRKSEKASISELMENVNNYLTFVDICTAPLGTDQWAGVGLKFTNI